MRMDIRLMTTMVRKRIVSNVLLALSFFLMSSRCRCDADVEHQVKEIQNNQTTGIILSAKSKKISAGTALEMESSTNRSLLLEDQEAYGIIFNVYIKQLTLKDKSIITSDYYSSNNQNVVDLTTGVFIATIGGPYLLNFRGVNIGSSSIIKSSGTSIALLLVNGIVRATSYGDPGERNIASISISLNLELGDRVHIFVSGAKHFSNNGTDDDDNYYTQFYGMKHGLA